MKYYSQFTIISKILRYLANNLENALEHFAKSKWFDKYIPDTGKLLNLLKHLCDLRDWLFKKSVMLDPKQIVHPTDRTLS